MNFQRLFTFFYVIIFIKISSTQNVKSNTTCGFIKGTSIFQKSLNEINSILDTYDRVFLNFYEKLTGKCDLVNDFEYSEQDVKHHYPDYQFLKDLEKYVDNIALLEISNMEENFDKLTKSKEESLMYIKSHDTWNQFD